MLRTMTKVVGSFSQASGWYKGERMFRVVCAQDAKSEFWGLVAGWALVEQCLKNWEAWW